MLLSIEKLIYGGDGLARTPTGPDGRSMTVFTPFVLPGEKVEAEVRQEKAGFARGALTHVVAAAPNRVEAPCPYFRQCGGCHYQHIQYQSQLDFKAATLRETLQRIAKLELKSDIRIHPSPPWNYRNRTRLQVLGVPQFELGYFRFGSHEFLPVRECPISSPRINRVMQRILELRGLDCPPSLEELELFADAADDRLLAWGFCRHEGSQQDLLRWSESLLHEVPEVDGVSLFPSRRHVDQDTDSSENGRPLTQAGEKSLRYRVGTHDFQVSASSFFQVNRHLVDEMVRVVTHDVSGELALDLYAGVGLFSAALAKTIRHTFAVEASQTAYSDLLQNVPANVKAVGARTEDYLRGRLARKSPDLVVLDPPRAGLGKVVTRSLVELGAPFVRYVSCDPATLARDLVSILAGGYHIEEAHLFDLFPQTFHIETVLLLAR